MSKTGFLSCLAVIVFAGCAKPADVKEELPFQPTDEGGFYELNDPAVPDPIRLASKSVYHILVPLAQAAEDVDFSSGKGNLLKLAYLLNFQTNIYQQVILSQIEACLNVPGLIDPKTQTCKISYSFSTGAGFLAGDGQTVWTAAHVVNGGLRFRRAVKNSGPPTFWPVYIFDQTGKLMVSPEKDFIQPVRFANYFSTQIVDVAYEQTGTDYIAMRLPDVIGVPLPIAKAPPAPGGRLFAIGYPACTNCPLATEQRYDNSDRSPHPNAPGGEMRVSFGKVLQSVNDSVLLTSVDLTPGDSGGPSLTSDGEVIGISAATSFWMRNQVTQRLGVYTRPKFTPDRLNLALSP